MPVRKSKKREGESIGGLYIDITHHFPFSDLTQKVKLIF